MDEAAFAVAWVGMTVAGFIGPLLDFFWWLR